MNAIANELESEGSTCDRITVSELDWRVWFLGRGLGGCAGLTLFVGLWSLAVDETRWLALTSLAVSLAHACLILHFWRSRTTADASQATMSCYLTGAVGITTVALVMNAIGSKVPGLAPLFSLAFMNFIMAFTVPLLVKAQVSSARAVNLAAASTHTARQLPM